MKDEHEGGGAVARLKAAGKPALVLLLLLGLLFDAPVARADNCGSLSDCFFTLAITLAVVAAIALLIALLIGSGGGGLLALAGGGTWGSAAVATAWWMQVAATAAQAAVAAAVAGQILMMARPSGKERGSDIPSWAKGSRPQPGETPNQAAERLLNEKYGPGRYPKGPGSEFNKIKKFFERLLRLGGNK